MNYKKIFSLLAPTLLLSVGSLAAQESVSKTETVQIVAVDDQISENIDNLLGLLEKRLQLMHEVAKWKWNHTYPIENLAREKEMLSSIAKQAQEKNLDVNQVKEIFQAQITAAKLVQINAFEKWVEEDVDLVENAPDYNKDLLPQIDKLNAEILDQLALVLPALEKNTVSSAFKEKAASLLNADHIDESVRDVALDPFLSNPEKPQIAHQ